MDASIEGKKAAAHKAAELIAEGMVVGLGTGSTAALFVRALGTRVRDGLRIIGIPTSEATERLARQEGITLATLEDYVQLDVDVDGADAVDPSLNLVKGLGGALLREKIVAAASTRFIVIADDSKLVDTLEQAPLIPIEIVPFGWSRVAAELEGWGAQVMRRAAPNKSDEPFITDGGHFILDCRFADLTDPSALAMHVKALTGVVEHGLFLGMAAQAIIGTADGRVQVIDA